MAEITIQGAILSFPNVWKAEQINNQGDPKFTASFLLPPDADLGPLRAAVDKVVKEKWGDNPPKAFKSMPVVRAGEAASYVSTKFENWWLIRSSAKEQYPPKIVGPDRQDVIDRAQIYAGCKVAARLNIYPYDNKWGKGVSAGLRAIMKTGEGEPLGAAPVDVDSAFDSVQVDPDAAPSPEDPGTDTDTGSSPGGTYF